MGNALFILHKWYIVSDKWRWSRTYSSSIQVFNTFVRGKNHENRIHINWRKWLACLLVDNRWTCSRRLFRYCCTCKYVNLDLNLGTRTQITRFWFFFLLVFSFFFFLSFWWSNKMRHGIPIFCEDVHLVALWWL